jgi:hypothetical protein
VRDRRGEEREGVKEKETKKKIDAFVNNAILHYSQMHHKYILYLICIIEWKELLVIWLAVKINKLLEML